MPPARCTARLPRGCARASPRPWPPAPGRGGTPRSSRGPGCGRGCRWSTSGCGALGLRALEPGLDVTGVDLVPRPGYPGPFVQADAAEGLPFPDGAFDLAYASSVVEHVAPARRARFAAELARVARGLYVQTPAWSFPVEPHALLPAAHWLPGRPPAPVLAPRRPGPVGGRRAAAPLGARGPVPRGHGPRRARRPAREELGRHRAGRRPGALARVEGAVERPQPGLRPTSATLDDLELPGVERRRGAPVTSRLTSQKATPSASSAPARA